MEPLNETDFDLSSVCKLFGAIVTMPWLTVKKSGRPSEDVPVPRTTLCPEPKSSCSGSSFSDLAGKNKEEA